VPKSRADLNADLYQLHSALPLWRKALHAEADFLTQYETLSAKILASADDCDRDWVCAQLDNLRPPHYPDPAAAFDTRR
jgi:hypothetical protein